MSAFGVNSKARTPPFQVRLSLNSIRPSSVHDNRSEAMAGLAM